MVKDNTNKIATLITSGLVVLGFIMGFGIVRASLKRDREIKEISLKVAENMRTKLASDLSQKNIKLSDGSVVDLPSTDITLSHINLSSDNNILGVNQKALNIYGTINEKNSFKTTYELSQSQYSELTQKMSAKEALKKLDEIFAQLELSEYSFSDIKALTLGFNDEKQFINLAKNMGPALPNNKFFKNNENITPNAFIPVYSQFNIVEDNGKKFAEINLEGVAVHTEKKLNTSGILLGLSLYGNGMDFSTSYITGLSVAIATSIEEHDTYFRTENIRMELSPEHLNMTDEQIREIMFKQMGSKEHNLQFKTISLSENLQNQKNEIYAKIYEDKGLER